MLGKNITGIFGKNLLMLNKKNIIVSGAHRSGTTWTGRVISQHPGIIYCHEPFNIEKWKKSPLKYWFECIDENYSNETQKDIISHIEKIPDKSILTNLIKTKDPWRAYKKFKTNRRAKIRLIKDPIALFSIPWLVKKLEAFPIILIRHPAAFVASIKHKQWEFDFNHFLNQSNLMNVYLYHYREEVTAFSESRKDIIAQGILLWNIFHNYIHHIRNTYKDWYFITHEKLSINPIEEFERIFYCLNLDFSEDVKKYIIKTSQNVNSTGQNLTSIENIKNWKKRLQKDDIKRVKEGTAEIWNIFYNENDW